MMKLEKIENYYQGAWRDSEHRLLIEALHIYGKDLRQVSNHIKSRNYTQVINYVTKYKRFLQLKIDNIGNPRDLNSAKYDLFFR